jgi:hypothetical protein
METEDLFDCLWRRHVALSPSAQRLRAALKERGEAVVEDHVAFRTFDLSPVGLESLAAPWMDRGWVETGRYEFPAKRLTARSYSHQSGGYPRVFVSELRTQEFSGRLQRVARECVGAVDALGTDLLLAGRPWPAVDRATYDALRAESEYAAWLAVFGYVANHFTVSVNSLRGFDDLGVCDRALEPLTNAPGDTEARHEPRRTVVGQRWWTAYVERCQPRDGPRLEGRH